MLAQEAVARATTGKSHPAPAAEPPTAEPAADDLRVAEAIPASEHRCDRCDAPMAFHVVEDRRYCGRCHAGIVRRHRRVKATWLGATVLVVFLGIVAGAFILSRVGGPSIDPVIREVAVVPVPSVVGMLAADAREVLHAKGFTSTRVIGRRGDSGRVVSQDPPAGARAGVNVVVRLRVE